VEKFDFHHSKLRKHLFIKQFDGKMSNFKMLGRSWPGVRDAVALKRLCAVCQAFLTQLL